jgi:Probable cobalt transporter subunit (CbtA).
MMFSRFDPARPASALLAAMLVGVVAGLGSAAFLSLTGEPSIEDAIDIEEANAAKEAEHLGAGHEEAPEVSREVQRGAGLFGAYALIGAAFGALFGVTFLALRKRVSRVFPRALVSGAVLAGAITVSPWLKSRPTRRRW